MARGPVGVALMIERTESAPKRDWFVAAMLGLPEEARAIEEGQMDQENSPLMRALTVEDLVGDWGRTQSREAECYPPGAFREEKYRGAPANRVDKAWGGQHLVCSCPPLASCAQAAE